LLVSLDIRERLGAFFTPSQWVRLAHEYMADAWGDLKDYYIWDCAGGTGNLLEGLDNPRNVFISDVNIENVYITQGRNATGELNLLENHIFQFDFLNDGFDKLPKVLKDIIDDENERKKLIIFMNPPYAETNARKLSEKGSAGNKAGIQKTKIYEKYEKKLFSTAKRELFAQFLTRIYFEISDCKIGTFSKLKTINAPNFKSFREFFKAKFIKGFICPS
jgi:hypothetical protein